MEGQKTRQTTIMPEMQEHLLGYADKGHRSYAKEVDLKEAVRQRLLVLGQISSSPSLRIGHDSALTVLNPFLQLSASGGGYWRLQHALRIGSAMSVVRLTAMTLIK